MSFNKNKIEFLIFKLLEFFSSIFGLKNSYIIGTIVGLTFCYLIPVRKKTVYSNLQKAFPEYEKKKIKKLIRANYISIGTLFAEIMCVPRCTEREIFEKFEADRELMIKNFTHDKGVILLTGHFGNWELGAILTGLILQKSINVLVKPQRNGYITDWLKEMRGKFGNKSVMLGTSVRELYSLLKKGEIAGVVGDQRGPIEGMRVNYFGYETAVYSGVAEIAVKTESKIVLCFVVRKANKKYTLEMEEIDYKNFTGTSEDKVKMINVQYFSILEKYVRLYPSQWFWMHKIWKY